MSFKSEKLPIVNGLSFIVTNFQNHHFEIFFYALSTVCSSYSQLASLKIRCHHLRSNSNSTYTFWITFASALDYLNLTLSSLQKTLLKPKFLGKVFSDYTRLHYLKSIYKLDTSKLTYT
jgi:hypothetical protein